MSYSVRSVGKNRFLVVHRRWFRKDRQRTAIWDGDRGLPYFYWQFRGCQGLRIINPFITRALSKIVKGEDADDWQPVEALPEARLLEGP